MKKLLVILFILCATTLSFAQSQAHKLTMDRGFFTTDYAIDGQEVDCDAFEQELAKVPEAISKWKTGNILRYTSWGVAAGGGFLVGYSIAVGSAPGSSDQGYKRTLALGGVIIVAAFVIEYIGNSKKDGAVELYNNEIGKIAGNESVNLSLVPTEQGGIALAFNF